MAKLASRSWTDEETYWRQNYKTRSYADQGQSYESFGPAYRFGYDAYERYPNTSWTDVEPNLSREWGTYEHRGQSTWQQMKDAVKDAWDRMTGNR